MRSINIAILAQLCGNEGFSAYENTYSRRSKRKNTPAHEQEALKDLLVQLGSDITFEELDGFYFSYSIPQISKEFDLLRITDDAVLDIELKSDTVAEAKIHKQLVRNKYYLGHLERTTYLFTYVKGGWVYTLDEQNHLAKTTVLELKNRVKQTQKALEIEDIDQFFKPSRFLISPLNTPERFLKGDYFLTDQQEEYHQSAGRHLLSWVWSDGFWAISLYHSPRWDVSIFCSVFQICSFIEVYSQLGFLLMFLFPRGKLAHAIVALIVSLYHGQHGTGDALDGCIRDVHAAVCLVR